ncbi:MAG: hypothetical protein ONB46_17265 [candidate division KSB1 bacterium]|nr:hypothetical protein [candidate division KSB1 bacterium]MDZ7367414.1 hypothetical protein [candidate division KSB1 bacterium]MDZ7405481.1 hypothetical protein [candidate division KSB1 bacterium]
MNRLSSLGLRELLFLAVISLCCLFAFGGGGCFDDIEDELRKAREQALFELDKAINNLSNDLNSWKFVLQDLENKLAHDVQQTLRGDVTQLLRMGIGAAGSQIVCVMDAIPKRILRGLQVARARFLGEAIPLLEPTICMTSMSVIDLALSPERRKEIIYNGYDILNDPLTLQAVLRKSNGEELVLTNRLHKNTDYQFTINLAGLLDNFLDDFLLLAVKFDNKKDLSQIAIQPKIPKPPQTREVLASISPITYVPPHTQGDAEFEGHGPRVTISVYIYRQPRYAYLKVYMMASETMSDWTTAKGWSSEHRIYDAPAGWHIKSINGKTAWAPALVYTDSNWRDDIFNIDLGQLTVTGDTDGHEAGTRTKVNIKFSYRVPIVIEEDVAGLIVLPINEELQITQAKY